MDLITVTRQNELLSSLNVRGHEVMSALSRRDGGADRGPLPSGRLTCALGSCIAMMVQFCCRRRRHDDDVGASLMLKLTGNLNRTGRTVVGLERPERVPDNNVRAIRRVAESGPIHETFLNPPALGIEIVWARSVAATRLHTAA